MTEGNVDEKHNINSTLSSIGWALFFIWIGIAFLVGFNEGVGLLGIGVITLGIQFARKLSGLAFEGFWVVVGVLFVLGSFWNLYEVDIPIIPILLIIAGLVILFSIVRGNK